MKMTSAQHERVIRQLMQSGEERGEVEQLIAKGRLGEAEKRVLQGIANRVKDGTVDLDSAHFRYRKLGVKPNDFIDRYCK